MAALLWPFRILVLLMRIVLFPIGTFLSITPFIIAKALTGSVSGGRWFHNTCRMMFNINMRLIGEPAYGPGRTVLFVGNHVSYADISVIGSILKNSVFVAKGEVRGWPLFGWLATLQDTVFIVRQRTAMEQALVQVSKQISLGRNIILFPEGTTGMGDTALPFKAGLFELAYAKAPDGKMLVQPMALVIEKIDGKPADTQEMRDYYSWWRKEEAMLPHLIRMSTRFRIDVAIHFLDVLDPADYPDRKDLALAAENAVKAVVEAGIRRR
ncbi:MAG TPA: lysophospholipid acyltransferase family protein [Alphaproteobacteria bacterium]